MTQGFDTAAIALGVFVFGACIGSFLNVVIWRLPRNQNLGGRSKCPHCQHTLSAWDLIPVFSFLLSNQRCRYCRRKISARYPLIELITGGLLLAAYLRISPGDWPAALLLVQFAVIIATAIAVFAIDLEHYLILDKIVFPAAAAVLLLSALTDFANLPTHLLAAASAFAAFGLIWYLSQGKWLGFGDVKLAGFMGLALGFPGILVALFIAFTSGAVIGVGLILAGKKDLSSQLPFGTFLAASMILALFYGPTLWHWYWGLFEIMV
jgi:prepilin signal peptidase PulO-like enzyme (type II secretory pathway)